MAKIKYDEIIDQQSFDAGMKALIAQVTELENAFKKMATAAGGSLKKNTYSSSSDLKAHEKDINAVNTAEKGLIETEKQKILLDKQLKESTDENVKAKIRYANAAKEQRDILKYELQVSQSAEGSYAKLSAQYNLNKMSLNKMSEAQRSGTAEGMKLETETNAIYQAMKKLQEATGKNVLSVGDYGIATKSLKAELRETKEELTRLIQAGAAMSDERVIKLSQKYDELGDAMTKAKNAANLSDKAGMFIGFTKTIATMSAGFQVAQGAAALFGTENEKLQKTMLKIQALLSVTYGLEVLANNLKKEGAVITFLQVTASKIRAASLFKETAATVALTTAQKAMNVASKVGPYIVLAAAFAAIGKVVSIISDEYHDAAIANENWNNMMDESGVLTADQKTKLDELLKALRKLKNEYAVTTGEMTQLDSDRSDAVETHYDTYVEILTKKHAEIIAGENALAAKLLLINTNSVKSTKKVSDENVEILYTQQEVDAEHVRMKEIWEGKKLEIVKKYLPLINTEYERYSTEIKTLEAKDEKDKLESQEAAWEKYLAAYRSWLQKIQDMNDEFIGDEEEVEKQKNSRKYERDIAELNESVLTANQKAEFLIDISEYYYQKELEITEKYAKERRAKLKEISQNEYDQMVKMKEEELAYLQAFDKLIYLETITAGEDNSNTKATQNEFELKQLQEQYDALIKESVNYAQDEIDLAIKIREKKIEIAQGEYDALKELMNKDIEDYEKQLEEKEKSEEEFLEAVQDTSEKIIESYIDRSKAKQDALDDELEASKSYEEQLKELAKKGIEDATNNLAFEQKKQAEIESKKAQELKKQKRLELGLAAVTSYGKLAETDQKTALSKTITEIIKLMAFINTIPEFEDGVIALKGRRKTSATDDTIAKIGPGESVMTAPATYKYYEQLKDMQSMRYNPADYLEMPKFSKESVTSTDEKLLCKVDELNKSVQNIPGYQIDVNLLTHEIIERVTKGNNTTINIHKPKGLF